MPPRECPRCGEKEPIWKISEGKCQSCGYIYTDIIDNPSGPQQKKNDKHFNGMEKPSEKNWVFDNDIDKLTLVNITATKGSCVDDYCIICSFDREIGYNQLNPTRRTNWAKLVLYNFPDDVHIYPIDPSDVLDTIFTPYKDINIVCKHCGNHNKGCPPYCEHCGNNPWVKD